MVERYTLVSDLNQRLEEYRESNKTSRKCLLSFNCVVPGGPGKVVHVQFAWTDLLRKTSIYSREPYQHVRAR